MRKAGRKYWRTLVLLGLALILGTSLLIQGLGLVWGWLAPAVQTSGSGNPAETAECTSQQHKPLVGQALIVNGDEVWCGDLTLFGGSLDVTGQMRGNIRAFGSNINIAGTVDGNVDLYGSTATLQPGSHVRGNIEVFGGRARSEKGAHLDGTVNNRSEHISFWLPGVNSGFTFPLWPMVIWVALGLVFTSLLPEHLMFVRTTLASKARRSLLLGLLSFLLAPAVLLVLMALIIPIPLAMMIAIGLIAAWALGTIAFGWLVGEYIMRVIAPRHNTRLAQVTVGLIVLVMVGSLPYIGWLVSIGAGLLGMGAVFLSRFGTRLYSQPRQPLRF